MGRLDSFHRRRHTRVESAMQLVSLLEPVWLGQPTEMRSTQ